MSVDLSSCKVTINAHFPKQFFIRLAIAIKLIGLVNRVLDYKFEVK